MPTPQIGYYGERLDMLIRQGATLGPFDAQMKNPAPPKGDGLPVNLTGCTIRGQIRKKALSTTITATLTCTIVNASEGRYRWELSAAQTGAIVAGEKVTDTTSQYVWDLELVDTAGRVTPLYYGACIVLREVTR